MSFSHDAAYFYLFYFIFYFILFYFILFYFILFYFIFYRCPNQILITYHLSDFNWFVCVKMRSCQDGATTSLVLTSTLES